MRAPSRFPAVLCAALLLPCLPPPGLRAQQQAPARGPLLPVAPSEIIAFLPAAPPDWKLTQSRASNQFMDWLTTESLREYRRPAPPPGRRPDGSAAPEWVTRVRIIDTGGWPAAAGEFAGARVGEGGVVSVEGFPAVRAEMGKDRERLRLFVQGRFLVQIDALNQPADSALAWVKLIDLQKLARVPGTGPDKLPKPITLVVLDELDPKKNSVSKLQWMTDAEMEAAARRTPVPASP